MLVLSRKKGQIIIINDDIEITVIDIKKNEVKIGIKAPKNVNIFRKELYEEIKNENIKAAKEVDMAGLSRVLNELPQKTKIKTKKGGETKK